MLNKQHLYKYATGGFDPRLCVSFCGQSRILREAQAPVDEMIEWARGCKPGGGDCKGCWRILHQLGKAKKS